MCLVCFMLYNLGRVKLTILSSILATIQRQNLPICKGKIKGLTRAQRKKPCSTVCTWFVLDLLYKSSSEAALEYEIVDLKPPNVHTKYKRGWRDGLDRHIMHAHADVAYLTNLDLME